MTHQYGITNLHCQKPSWSSSTTVDLTVAVRSIANQLIVLGSAVDLAVVLGAAVDLPSPPDRRGPRRCLTSHLGHPRHRMIGRGPLEVPYTSLSVMDISSGRGSHRRRTCHRELGMATRMSSAE